MKSGFSDIKYLFLDRDGVINRQIKDGYVTKISEFEFLPGSLDALSILSRAFQRIFIVTNQQGIGKGIFRMKDLEKIHSFMLSKIIQAGGWIDAVYVAPQLNAEQHPFRKPNTGMAKQAKQDFPEIEFAKSAMLGDSESDMQFGRNAGMKTVLLNSTQTVPVKWFPLVDEVWTDLAEFAVNII